MDWSEVDREIIEEEKSVADELGINIKVYGSGSQGYDRLYEYLYGTKGKLTKTVRKELYEYWVFLIFIRKLIGEFRFQGKETFSYQPTRGNDSQYPIVKTPRGSIFVEPCLTGYNENKILEEYKGKLNFLSKTTSRHVRPDFLITNFHTEKIPWGVWLWHSAGLADEEKFYKEWERFSPQVKFIVECKEDNLKDNDLSQALWYCLAYKKPLILVLQGEIEKEGVFREDIERIKELGQNIEVIENFKIGRKRECMEKIDFLADLDVEI